MSHPATRALTEAPARAVRGGELSPGSGRLRTQVPGLVRAGVGAAVRGGQDERRQRRRDCSRGGRDTRQDPELEGCLDIVLNYTRRLRHDLSK